MFDVVGFDPESYSIAIQIFLRLLGALFIVVYLPFILHIRGLFGVNGILPMRKYLSLIQRRVGKKRFYYIPSLFWLNASDAALLALAWSGLILGALLMMGVWPSLLLILLYVIHLSLTSAGQDFLSFGWEMFLLEITLGMFLVISTTPYNMLAWIGFNVLLLRFYFQAGISKIFSQDPNWRNLTALWYHYLTQPLPNTLAWYFQKLPLWFHKFSALYMYFVELIVPWAIFSPPEVRLFVFSQYVALQLGIYLTGNFSYLNHMSVIASIVFIHNKFLEPFFSLPAGSEPSPFLWQQGMAILGGVFLALQLMSLWHTFFPRTLFNTIIYFLRPFHVADPHGIFAVMTTKRYEIILEGSNDGEDWKEYGFYSKPGKLSWRPRRISPFQPRLDWQAWFLPFGIFHEEVWFQKFLLKLLEGSPLVIKLLKTNPFPEAPPSYIRAVVYDYEYTTFEEKAKTGNWWKRHYVGLYSPTLSL